MSRVFVALIWEPALMTPDLYCGVFDTEEQAYNRILPGDMTKEEFLALVPVRDKLISECGYDVMDESIDVELVGQMMEDEDPEPLFFDEPDLHEDWFTRMERRASLLEVMPDGRVYEFNTGITSPEAMRMITGQGSFM